MPKNDPEDDPTLQEFHRTILEEEQYEQDRHVKHMELLARIREFLNRSKAPKESGGGGHV
jgi:hypothetical protein